MNPLTLLTIGTLIVAVIAIVFVTAIVFTITTKREQEYRKKYEDYLELRNDARKQRSNTSRDRS